MFRFVLLIVLLTGSPVHAKIRPADLLRPADYNAVLISPTGEYLAVVKSVDEDTWFTIYEMPARKATFNSNMGKKITIANIDWVSDDYLVVAPARKAFRDVKGLTGELFSINAKKGKIQRLSIEESCPYCGGAMVHPLPSEDEKIIVSGSFDQFSEAHLVDIRRNTFRRIARSPLEGGSFVANTEGKIVFAIGENPQNVTEIYQRVDGEWQMIDSYAYGEPGWLPIANGSKKGTFYTIDSRGGSTKALGLYDINTKEHHTIIRLDKVDIGSIYRDHNYNVYAVQSDLHYPAVHYLSQKHPLARVRAGLEKSLPGQTITFTSSTRDNTQVVALAQSDVNPGTYLMVDLKAGKVEKLFEAWSDLKADELSPMHPVEIKTRDNETIYAYLTEAKNVPKPGPLVLNLHGGPHGSRDFWGYNREVQMIANMGAHVLQVNFRGSGGYGRDFENAGHLKWGTLMQDDVTDATQWAIDNNIADPDRICIYGGSYGAYAALMGVAREPDMYQCAIGYVGVYDLTMLYTHGDISGSRGHAYLQKVIGTDKDDMMARSPVYLADHIKADVMLVQGAVDRRAPIQHSIKMRKALERAGKDVRWKTEPRQGHGFAGVTDALELYQEMAEFMAPHLALDLEPIDWSAD